MCPLSHHPLLWHGDKKGSAVGWPVPAQFSPPSLARDSPQLGIRVGSTTLPHCSSLLSLDRELRTPQGLCTSLERTPHAPQTFLAGAVVAAGSMLQARLRWCGHRSREETSMTFPRPGPWRGALCSASVTGTKPGPHCCRDKGFSAQCPWLLLPVASLVWAEQNPQSSESQPHTLWVTEPWHVI